MSQTIKRSVAAYIALRDERDTIKKRHSEELAPIIRKMAEFEAAFLHYLDSTGAQHVATEDGTVYKSMRTSVKVADWNACLAFVRDHDLWHLLEKRVSKTAIEEYLESEGTIPPGLDMSREATTNIRRNK